MNYSQAKSAAFKFKVANNKDRVKNSDGTCRGELRITTDGSVFRFRHDGVVKHTLSVACTDEARLMAHWLGFIGGIVR